MIYLSMKLCASRLVLAAKFKTIFAFSRRLRMVYCFRALNVDSYCLDNAVRIVAFSVRAYMQKHLTQNLAIVYEVSAVRA